METPALPIFHRRSTIAVVVVVRMDRGITVALVLLAETWPRLCLVNGRGRVGRLIGTAVPKFVEPFMTGRATPLRLRPPLKQDGRLLQLLTFDTG